MDRIDQLDDLRRRGVRVLTASGWAATLLLLALGASDALPQATPAAMFAAVGLVVPTLATWRAGARSAPSASSRAAG